MNNQKDEPHRIKTKTWLELTDIISSKAAFS